MRPVWGDDYSICCCVSATETGKEMQFFGARANLAKCLNYAINGGKDEKFMDQQGNHMQVGPEYAPITSEYLDYDEVMHKFDMMMDWLAELYVNILNLIQYMHDKYYYEAAEMALIDTNVRRTFATGIAGFSHVVDSISAMKYAKVKTIRDEQGIVVDYEVEGDFPKYGNDDDRVDDIAVWLLKNFMAKIAKHHTYPFRPPPPSCHAPPTWCTAKATGGTPDDAGVCVAGIAPPTAPSGLLASLNSVISSPTVRPGRHPTRSHQPSALGNDDEQRTSNLVNVLDGYFNSAHHLNDKRLWRQLKGRHGAPRSPRPPTSPSASPATP